MALSFKDDKEWQALVALEAKYDQVSLRHRGRSWAAIADMYLTACANPHITGSHWDYTKALAEDARRRADYCDLLTEEGA